MNRLPATVFCIFMLALPCHSHAQAQKRELTPGLNYTTLAKPKAEPAQPAENASADEEAGGDENNEQLDPTTQIWNKYKALATGTAQEEEQKAASSVDKPKPPEKPVTDRPALPSDKKEEVQAPQNAFGTILEKWKNSKDSQREMRTKSFRTPNSAPEDAKDPS